jgi:ribosomal protein S12 methylthiotransferase
MKIGFISLGCPKNLVDSEVMLGLARQAGHTLTTDASDADVLVVNTCAFIDSAKQESIDAILEMAAVKRAGRDEAERGGGAPASEELGGVQGSPPFKRRTRLVVTGCLAERYRDRLQREIPEIDVLLGTNEVPEIVRAIEGDGDGRAGQGNGRAEVPLHVPAKLFRREHGDAAARPAAGIVEKPLPTYIYDAKTPRLLTTPTHYAYMKIAEGCDYTCAFCIIPKLRGAYRSRPIDSLVEEAGKLVQRGVREIILISQDTTFYGVDRGERGALARLLRRLNAVDGLEWIRLLYLYPTTIDDSVMGAMAECEKVCKYVDLPLQHASAAVLKRMKRPGTGTSYRRLLDRIRTQVPGVILRTTFIVGFPGETDGDFAELRAFARDVRFDHLGVFTYSHEEGTSAHALPDDVPARVKAARRRALMETQRTLVARLNRERIGTRVRLVVDGKAAEHELVLKGRMEGQAPDIDSVIYLSDCDPAALAPGSFLEAEIVGARDYDLVARPFDSCP